MMSASKSLYSRHFTRFQQGTKTIKAFRKNRFFTLLDQYLTLILFLKNSKKWTVETSKITNFKGKIDRIAFKIPPLQNLTVFQWVVNCTNEAKDKMFRAERRIINANYTKIESESPRWFLFLLLIQKLASNM